MRGRRCLRRGDDGAGQQLGCTLRITRCIARGGLLAQVMRHAAAEAAFAMVLQLLRNLGGLRPVARALIDGQQREQGLCLIAAAFELAQCVLGAVEQAGLEEVQRQVVLGAVAVGGAEVGA